MNTMKTINHAAGASGGPITADFEPVVRCLRDIAKAMREGADKPPAELRVPLPEFHNEIKVSPTPIAYQAPAVDNEVIVNVSPTPVQVNVEPPSFNVDSPHVEMNLSTLVTAVYVLSGVIGASAVGIVTSLFLR